MNFPHHSRHIVHNLCSQSFLRRISSRREKLERGTCLGETGKGAQEKSLTFETFAMIVALLTDTILFFRRVIDIQNMLLNIMTVDKKKNETNKNKKQSIKARTDRRFQQPRDVAIGVCMRFNVFQCDRIEGVLWILENKGTKKKYRREQGGKNLF